MEASPHILIAEDESLVALALAAVLEDQGFRVTVTHNGRQALEADARDAADILVTDLRMPVMEGGELIREIRRSRPGLPVVVMTANGDLLPREERDRTFLLRKPFRLGSLIEIVQSMRLGVAA